MSSSVQWDHCDSGVSVKISCNCALQAVNSSANLRPFWGSTSAGAHFCIDLLGCYFLGSGHRWLLSPWLASVQAEDDVFGFHILSMGSVCLGSAAACPVSGACCEELRSKGTKSESRIRGRSGSNSGLWVMRTGTIRHERVGSV